VVDAPDTAVILACDAGYQPFSMALIHQIITHCPERRFDIMLVSLEPLALPDWAIKAGVGFMQITIGSEAAYLSTKRLPLATYLRLFLAERLQDRYRRILYLDSDIFFEGGDLDRLLGLDIGPHAVAAVRDVPFLLDPARHAEDHLIAGLPSAPYFNTGVIMIDCAGFERDQIRDRCLDLAKEYGDGFVYHDQALLNVALHGRFAELCPTWNWMATERLPQFTPALPVRFRHFVGPCKAWRDETGLFDRRFGDAYRNFFTTYDPKSLAMIAPSRRRPLLPGRAFAKLAYRLRVQATVKAGVARFPSEWAVGL
jgi:lipopolysaccharide biosynthesis glycosyltransferase